MICEKCDLLKVLFKGDRATFKLKDSQEKIIFAFYKESENGDIRNF